LRLLSELELGEEVRRKGMTIVGRKIHSLEAQNRVISVDCSHLTAPQSIAVAQSVARFSNSGKYAGGLLWIADWGISNESTENLAQFCVDKLRDGHVALTNAPAHELHKSDQLLTEALVMQTMVFRWGAYFIPERADHYIEISDDEAIIMFCLNEDVIDRALDYFSHWKPTVMDW
jgi:hypothetical protein